MEPARCRASPLHVHDMDPPQPSPHSALPAEAGTRWGARFFAVVLASLPPSAPPVQRRLLRSVYTIHRMVDTMATRPTDGEVWRLAGAIDTLKATASDACASGLDERHVQRLVALTTAAAGEILEIALEVDRVAWSESHAPPCTNPTDSSRD